MTTAPAQKVHHNGFGIAAIAVGLVGFMPALMPITSFFGAMFAVAGAVFALVALGRGSKALAVFSLVVNGLLLWLSIYGMTIFFGLIDSIGK